MEDVLKIIDLGKKGISSKWDLLIIVLSIVAVLVPAIMKLYKIISLNEFDRLLIPKHERNIQQLIVKLYDYLMFCFIYLGFGFLLSFCFNTKTLKGSFGGWFVLTVIILFLISLILLAPRVLVNEFLIKKDWKIVIWIKSAGEKSIFSWIFNIQLVLSFIVYSFFLGNPFMGGRHFGLYHYLALFFLPCFLLYIYRGFHQKAKFEYICQVIDQEIFNAAKPILKYSLDQDRTVFSSQGNDDLILYDKSSDIYFKFEKVHNQV